MAVAVIVDIPGGNPQVYEQLTAKLFQDGKLPRRLAGAPSRPNRRRLADH